VCEDIGLDWGIDMKINKKIRFDVPNWQLKYVGGYDYA
jgi:hypothetical protein